MARRVQLLSPHPPPEIVPRLRTRTRTPVRRLADGPGAEPAQLVGTVADAGFRPRLDTGDAGGLSVRGTFGAPASGTRMDLVFAHAMSPAVYLLGGSLFALVAQLPKRRAATHAWAVAEVPAAPAVPARLLLLGALVSSIFAIALREVLEAVAVPMHAVGASGPGR